MFVAAVPRAAVPRAARPDTAILNRLVCTGVNFPMVEHHCQPPSSRAAACRSLPQPAAACRSRSLPQPQIAAALGSRGRLGDKPDLTTGASMFVVGLCIPISIEPILFD